MNKENKENLIPVKGLSPFKRFCMTIGELPSSYLETMTYYEMLVWFTKYMQDTVIPTINNNASAVDELQDKYIEFTDNLLDRQTTFENNLTARQENYEEKVMTLFNNLQDFVNNYFNNLDVQEEINNKLDQMVEDGILQEIIADYLNSKAIFGFDNVSSMKQATNLINGSYARTLGYYNKNDGGSALYKIRTITNDDVVDEMFIIEMSTDNTLIAELITDNLVNICQVGGQQNFSNVCNTLLSTGKSIYIPKRTFTATSTIIVSENNTELICDGDINFTSENSTLFSIQSEKNVIRFNGNLSCPTNSVCISMGGTSKLVRACNVFIHQVQQSKVALLIEPNGDLSCVQTCQFTFDRLNGTEAAIKLACGNDGQPWANANVFNGGQVHSTYPIVSRKGTNQTDRYNQNIFNNIVCTGDIDIALDLQFMEKDYFNQIRMSEGHVGTYWVKLDSCQFVHIDNFSYIDIPTIQILNSRGLSYPNYIKGAYIRDSQDAWIATDMKELNGKFILEENTILNPNIAYIEAYGDTNPEFSSSEFYHNDMMVTIGADGDNLDLRFNLPDIFERRGVNSFYVLVKNKAQNTRFQVWCGNQWYFSVPVGTAVTNKLYHVTIGGKSFTGSPTVKATEVNLVNA